MDAIEQSTGIYAAAVALAKCIAPEDLNRAAVLLTQLGTTLGTIAALQAMEGGSNGQELLTGRV